MKKIIIWIAAGLMFLGISLFLGLGFYTNFDFTRLDSVKYITNTNDITDQFHSIDIDTVTADIEFRRAEDGQCRVVCYEREKMNHEVSVSNGVLEITVNDSRSWFDHITVFNFETPIVTVYLPERDYQSLKIDNTTGDLKLSGKWTVDELSLETTTGDISVTDISCKSDVFVHVTTGDIRLEDMTCKSLNAEGSTGDAVFTNVIAAAAMRVHRTTGDILLEKCDAEEIYINATTGDVTGTLLTSKVISAKATTGNVDVPKLTSGGRCEITTTTGDIRIDIL